MKKQLAFVLGGGGSRGALQVGALRALLEAGYRPDLWVGTSIGAVNATFLALRGFNQESLTALVGVWQDAVRADLLPSNYLWLTIRTLFNRSGGQINHRKIGRAHV
jgi:NTE family protein